MQEFVIPTFKRKTKKNKKLEAAAKKITKELNKHFKEDGWDINYSIMVDEVFYEAFGVNLEDYLLNELCKSKKYSLIFKDSGILIRKGK